MTQLKPDSRTTLFIAIVLAGLVLLAVGLTFPSLWRKARTEATDMDLVQQATSQRAVPPIDAAAPSDFETATFALG
jgi:hypothetical protein